MSAIWNDALVSMRTALKILDQSGAPLDVGAHLDLAIARLEEVIATAKEGSAPDAVKWPPRSSDELDH
jgi:hypothetical protein